MDYTNDCLYIHHLERSKRDVREVNSIIRTVLVNDGNNVFTHIEQEPGSMPLLFIDNLQSEYPTHTISSYSPREDKLYRSYELKRLAENGCLKFVVHPHGSREWIHTAIKELENFDGEDSDANKGEHDDIVDSFSSAANYFKLNRILYTPY